MITVFIGGTSRELGSITDSWIKEQITRRRDDSVPVCVRVEIRCRLASVTLATPGCSSGGGGFREPTDIERRIFALWDSWKLNSSDFSPGNLIAFLKRAEEMAC